VSKPSDPRMFEGSYNNKHPEYWTKITLRDLFAAAALAGKWSLYDIDDRDPEADIAKRIYWIADAMLAARDRGEEES